VPFDLLDVFGRVSTRVSNLGSRFDLRHAARRELLPVHGGGVSHDLLQGLVTRQRHDLVRGEVRLGGYPAEGFAKPVGVQVIR
jgi:hypothetical protein